MAMRHDAMAHEVGLESTQIVILSLTLKLKASLLRLLTNFNSIILLIVLSVRAVNLL